MYTSLNPLVELLRKLTRYPLAGDGRGQCGPIVLCLISGKDVEDHFILGPF